MKFKGFRAAGSAYGLLVCLERAPATLVMLPRHGAGLRLAPHTLESGDTKAGRVYPALTRQTHMQGTVVLEAILDEQGNVTDMRVVSGPLLIQAAV